MILERGAIEYLVETFSSLAGLCSKAELEEVPVKAIRQELGERWLKLRGILAGGKRQGEKGKSTRFLMGPWACVRPTV